MISLSDERNVRTSRYGRSTQQHGAVGNLAFCSTQTNSYVFSINWAIQLSLAAGCVRRSKAERLVAGSLKLVHSLCSHLTADGLRACHCRVKLHGMLCSRSIGDSPALQYGEGACPGVLQLVRSLFRCLVVHVFPAIAREIVQCLLGASRFERFVVIGAVAKAR